MAQAPQLNYSDFSQLGLQILKMSDGSFILYQPGDNSQRRQVRQLAPHVAQELINQGFQVKDLSGVQQEQSALARAGYDFSTGGGNISNIGEVTQAFQGYWGNRENQRIVQEQETMSRKVNDWIAQNKDTKGLIEPPPDVQAWFQKENGTKYYMQDGVFMNEASLGNKAKELEYEKAVAAGHMKKVPIGNGFGYIPTGSPGDLLMNNPDEYYRKYPDQQRPGSTPTPSQPGSPSVPSTPSTPGPVALSKSSFTELFKNPGSDTVYGRTKDGKVIAFETGKQFTDLGLSWGDVVTKNDVPTGVINMSAFISGQTTPGSTTPSTSLDLPDDIKNNEYFKALDDEGKALAAQYYKTLASGSAEEATKFSNALQVALKQADPYWKEKLRVVTDELERSLSSSDKDLGAKEEEYSRRIREIEEDLTYNRDQLTIEQQAELARQARGYRDDLDMVRETMAERGLSSSTIKTRTEERLSQVNDDIVESTTRKYNRDQRNLGVTAGRNITTYQKNLEELRRSISESKIGNVRKVESVLGTDATKMIPGAGNLTLGGLSGSIKDEQANDVLARARALLQGQINL